MKQHQPNPASLQPHEGGLGAVDATSTRHAIESLKPGAPAAARQAVLAFGERFNAVFPGREHASVRHLVHTLPQLIARNDHETAARFIDAIDRSVMIDIERLSDKSKPAGFLELEGARMQVYESLCEFSAHCKRLAANPHNGSIYGARATLPVKEGESAALSIGPA